MCENKETTNETTNEELLDHLQEIEIAIACQITVMATLFQIISAHSNELCLGAEEQEMVTGGLSSMSGYIDILIKKSDLEGRVKKQDEE